MAPNVAPFYRVVRSEFYVYGKRDGKLFERVFSSAKNLEGFIARLDKELGASERARALSELERLVVAIDAGEAHQV